ncbi:MAG TPA: serine protease [Gemmata sp.]|nr:serine protease [Gemmata sp.]
MQRFFIIALLTSITPFLMAEVPEDIRDRGKAATVKVTSDADNQNGSGVAIAQGGAHTYFLTACHIVPTAKKVEVKVSGGKTYTAEVFVRSPESDLAILRLPTSEGLPVPIKLAAMGIKPKNLLSIGWEKGDAPNCLDESFKGKVRLKKPGETNAVLCWEVERKPAAGRSGGPLLDESGLVLGVASGHDGKTGYYVHIDEIHAFLRLSGLRWLTEEEKR